jgi:hypothetical protein
MTMHTGNMIVTNNWTTPISGYVTHHTSDWPDTTVSFTNLAVGASTPPQGITTSTSDTDHWQYSMTDGSGYTWQSEKDCGFEGSDSGGTVTCAFVAQGPEFQINMPVSSSCSQGMSGYVGLMQVTNNLWAPITGNVQHYTTDYGTTTVEFTNLAVGASTPPQGIATGSSNTDQWSYSISLAGVSSSGSKNCGYESSDAPNTATVAFSGTDSNNSELQVNMPSSSSCSSSMSFS